MSKYQDLGVDAGKSKVRKTFGKIVRNDFPGAFVNIARDPKRPGMVYTMYSDGDGSKFVQRLLHFCETGNEQVIQGAVDDAMGMNMGDIAASGFVTVRLVINQTIAINCQTVPKDIVLDQIAERAETLLGQYTSFGFEPVLLGGETADLPDQCQSVIYHVAVYAETEEANLVRGNVQPGDRIYGLASDGQASWEESDNTGLMTNGLTLARTYTMHADYGGKYPHLIRRYGMYKGAFLLNDKPAILGGKSVSQALLSPTRQWAFFIHLLIQRLKSDGIFPLLHGISQNSGGGATKIMNVGQGVVYEKKMPTPPVIFRLIQEESGEVWRDMYKDCNCGVGLDIVGAADPRFDKAIKEVSAAAGIGLYELGVCQASSDGINKVVLNTPYGRFNDY